jgi:hypothetical protein
VTAISSWSSSRRWPERIFLVAAAVVLAGVAFATWLRSSGGTTSAISTRRSSSYGLLFLFRLVVPSLVVFFDILDPKG